MDHPSANGERGGTGGGVDNVAVFVVVVVAVAPVAVAAGVAAAAVAAPVMLLLLCAAADVAWDAGGSCRQVLRSSSRCGAFCSMLAVFK